MVAASLNPTSTSVVGQARAVEDLLDVGMGGEMVDVEGLVDRGAEQQVLGERRVAVVALGVEHLDQAAEARIREALAHRTARLEHRRRDLGLRLGVDRAAQAHLIDVAIEAHHGQRPHRRRHHLLGPAQPGARVVDPVGLAVERQVARALRFQHVALELLGRGPLQIPRPHGAMPQAEQQIVGDRAGEDLRRIADMGHAPPGDRFGQLVQLDDR